MRRTLTACFRLCLDRSETGRQEPMMRNSWTLRAVIATPGLSLTLLSGRNPSATRPKLAEGERSYAKQCAGCHGANAHGTDRGPGVGYSGKKEEPIGPGRGALALWVLPLPPGAGGCGYETFVCGSDLQPGHTVSCGLPPFDLPAYELNALA